MGKKLGKGEEWLDFQKQEITLLYEKNLLRPTAYKIATVMQHGAENNS